MAFFQYSEWIKKKREDLGLSQEELADGICSVPTLSRIENGRRAPSAEHFQRILERLGYSSYYFDNHANDKEFYLHELKHQILRAYVVKDMRRAQKLLKEFEAKSEDNNFNRQFILLYDTLFHTAAYSNEEMLERMEQALRLTCPKYSPSFLPRVLCHEEVTLVNGIANCNALLGRYKEAIRLYQYLKLYFESGSVQSEEVLRTQPMVLYNFSKVLGMAGRYDECIEVCEQGIRIAQETGRVLAMAGTYYNMGWALVKQGNPIDRERAKQAVRRAWQLAEIMGQKASAERYEKFYREHFPDEVLNNCP